MVDPRLRRDLQRTQADTQEEELWESRVRKMVAEAMEQWDELIKAYEETGEEFQEDDPWRYDWYEQLLVPKIDKILQQKLEEFKAIRYELFIEQLPVTMAHKRQLYRLQRVIAVLHQLKELSKQEEVDAYRRARAEGALISQGLWYVLRSVPPAITHQTCSINMEEYNDHYLFESNV